MTHVSQRSPDLESTVGVVVARWNRDPTRLLQVLREVQEACGWLPPAALAQVARQLDLPLARVRGVAGFYAFLYTRPVGRYRVLFSDNVTDRMQGSESLLAAMCHRLWVERGKVSEDGLVSVDTTSCTGLCDQGPAMLVNGRAIGRLDAERVEHVCGLILRELPPERWPAELFVIDDNVRRADVLLGHGLAPGEPIFAALRRGAQGRRERAANERSWREGYVGAALGPLAVLEEVKRSGLRGRGGAGFTTGTKWEACRHAIGGTRYVVCNADEGEPGTFKDRVLLERDPHRFLEGMLIAAWAVGIVRIYIYLRDEYHGCRVLLEAELEKLRAHPPVAALPEIVLRRGAGAYICGEESAMIESIEGKRGLPRLRPPFVAQVGLFGRPTLEHNFETLYWVRELVERGGDWFASHGRNGRTGLRSYSVSGRVREPGVKLAPAGITVQELIDDHCGGMQEGHVFYAYLPGGASGGILPATMNDIPLDFDTLQPYGCFIGSAAVIVLSDHDTAVGAARNMMRFFKHESCGQCTPCRNGTAKASALIDEPHWDLELLADLSAVMRDASICGLGQAAPNPFDCVVRYFAHELA